MGAVDAVEWACILCGCHIKNDWVSRATDLHQICVKLEHCSTETIQMIQKAFGDDAMSAVQIKVRHKHFEDGWESVESDPHSGRPATSRTSENVEHVQAAISKDGRQCENQKLIWRFQKLLCLRFWCMILAWNVSWQTLFCDFSYQSRRNIVLQLLMTWFKLLPMNQISSRRSYLWRGLRHRCPMYLVSCILYLLQ